MDVLFRDDRVIAVRKPERQLVIPGRGHETSECLKEELSQKIGAPVFVVHRIDRETSGVVLFALDAVSHRFLCRAFENRLIGKGYLAAVVGVPRLPSGAIDLPLRVFGSGRVGTDPRGKPSRTEFEMIAQWRGGSLLRVRPVTGRPHQIRAHLTEIGLPILGDPLYGPPPRPIGGAPRLMLHAEKIDFPHPSGGERSVTCGAGESFFSYLKVVSQSEIVYLDDRGGYSK